MEALFLILPVACMVILATYAGVELYKSFLKVNKSNKFLRNYFDICQDALDNEMKDDNLEKLHALQAQVKSYLEIAEKDIE